MTYFCGTFHQPPTITGYTAEKAGHTGSYELAQRYQGNMR